MSTKPTFWSRIANRINTSIKKKGNRASIAAVQMTRIRQDAETRRQAMIEAELAYFPHRVKLQRLYLNTAENGHIMACIERRKDLTLLRKWEFTSPGGTVDDNVTQLFFNIDAKGNLTKKEWFNNFLSFTLDAIYYGYSLIFLGDIENNEFVGTEVVKRWNVSPDRLIVSHFEYMTTGTSFVDDQAVAGFHVYVPTPNKIGTSNCGFGLYYELSVYENLLRNLLGFNGDYIEVNIAPFRQIKTYKTEEAEREELFRTALNMASNGVALTDPEDEIIFHPSGGSGTGYNAYDQFEKRLEAKISQLILGHADAISSIPGKLGNSKEKSPAEKALEDKQTKDGEFVLAIVNKVLFAKMRALGFNIPDGTTACMLNDNEEVDNANNVADLAVKMLSGGLQMDRKYFTDKTNIPVAEPTSPIVPLKQNITPKIANRLKEIYAK